MAAIAAAIACNGWLSHRADTAVAAAQSAADVRAAADQAALWTQARQIAIPTGLVASATFNGTNCLLEKPEHLNVGCWTSSATDGRGQEPTDRQR